MTKWKYFVLMKSVMIGIDVVVPHNIRGNLKFDNTFPFDCGDAK